MSLKYRDSQGTETPVAGLNGTSGELVPSVALKQSGSSEQIGSLAANAGKLITATFATPMPDADYELILNPANAQIGCTVTARTTTGFTLYVSNNSDATISASSVDYVAFKLMTDTVHEADAAHIAQNTANFAPAFNETTSYAVGDYVTYNGTLYRCTTAHTAGVWVAGHFTAVTVGEDLASHYVPNTSLTSSVTSGSTAPVTSGGVYDVTAVKSGVFPFNLNTTFCSGGNLYCTAIGNKLITLNGWIKLKAGTYSSQDVIATLKDGKTFGTNHALLLVARDNNPTTILQLWCDVNSSNISVRLGTGFILSAETEFYFISSVLTLL